MRDATFIAGDPRYAKKDKVRRNLVTVDNSLSKTDRPSEL